MVRLKNYLCSWQGIFLLLLMVAAVVIWTYVAVACQGTADNDATDARMYEFSTR